MAALELKLLGNFEGRTNSGRAIELPTSKTRLLLSFLALSPGVAQPRRKLATLLWSDRGDEQALHSLRQSLLAIRKVLAPLDAPLLVANREQVSLEAAAIEVDAVEFQILAVTGKSDSLAKACALYRGDLLEGVEAVDPSFEAWLFYERQRLRNLALKAFEQLLVYQQEGGKTAQAIETAQRLLQLESTHEETHRVLMRLYTDQGRRSAALEQYKHCRSALGGELDVEPGPETEQLYQQILQHWKKLTLTNSPPNSAPAAVAPTALPLPESPSIAVLPFRNLTTEVDDDYFVDGLTESVITELSRYPDLMVIASNSVFTYKGRPVKIQKVSQELGVRHILEGSLQRSGNRVRVTAQLIDAISGHHVWAQRYEGDLSDVFALQDEFTQEIVGALATSYGGRLTKAWRNLSDRKNETSLGAYDYLLRGEAQIEGMTQDAVLEARRLFEKAIEVDPKYARAHAKLALTYILAVSDGWAESLLSATERAKDLAHAAIVLDDSNPWGHWALGCVYCGLLMDYDKGLGAYERALELCPNDADVLADHGWVLGLAGQPSKGIDQVRQALRLNPHYPRWYMTGLGLCYHDARAYEKAVSVLREAPVDNPTCCLYLAAGYGQLGRHEEADKQVKTILDAEPDLSVERLRPRAPYKQPKDFEHLLDGLRKAGLQL